MKSAGLATTGAEWIGRAPHEDVQRGRPVLPAHHPFYPPPAGFEHAAPGTVLRSRDVELAFMGLIPQKFTATQLLYRSTARNGVPEATVTTVLAPTERGPEKVCPVVSYQCAIDAVASRCFPSYALRRGAFAVGALPQFHGLGAALEYVRLSLSPSAQIGLWRYSGSGLASPWASQVASDYAPELDIAG